MSFTLTALIPGVGPHYAAAATSGIVSISILYLGYRARKTLGSGQEAIIPSTKPSVRGVFEFLTEYIVGMVDTVIGHEGRKYVPLFSSIFLFVFVNNIVGLIPGMTPATESLSMTLAMGTAVFIFYNTLGIQANGWLGYLKHFMGPVWWLSIIFVVVEFISHLARPLSLGLRLANVMMGDHMVIGIFTDLVPILIPLPFYLLGLFICFIQAFVFTMLTMVYVSIATAHEH